MREQRQLFMERAQRKRVVVRPARLRALRRRRRARSRVYSDACRYHMMSSPCISAAARQDSGRRAKHAWCGERCGGAARIVLV